MMKSFQKKMFFWDIVFKREIEPTVEFFKNHEITFININNYIKEFDYFCRKNYIINFKETFISQIPLSCLLYIFEKYIINNAYFPKISIGLNFANQFINVKDLDKKVQTLIFLHIALKNNHILDIDGKKIKINNIYNNGTNIVIEMIYIEKEISTIEEIDLLTLSNKNIYQDKKTSWMSEPTNHIKNENVILVLKGAKILDNLNDENNNLILEVSKEEYCKLINSKNQSL